MLEWITILGGLVVGAMMVQFLTVIDKAHEPVCLRCRRSHSIIFYGINLCCHDIDLTFYLT